MFPCIAPRTSVIQSPALILYDAWSVKNWQLMVSTIDVQFKTVFRL